MRHRHRAVALYCFLVLVAVAFISFAGPKLLPPQATAANERLHALYHNLHQQVNPVAWPDRSAARKLWRGLHRTANGTVRPNKFASDGPLQVTAFFSDDEAMLSIVREARRHIFEPLVSELRAGLRRHSQDVLDRGLWIPNDDSLHAIVRVFSEHPSLLDTEDAKRWRPISEEQCQRLGSAVETHLLQRGYMGVLGKGPVGERPVAKRLALRVWGYALTADGSMLILFDEEQTVLGTGMTSQLSPQLTSTAVHGRGRAHTHAYAHAGSLSAWSWWHSPQHRPLRDPSPASLLALRDELGAVGESVLGALNSRPKVMDGP